MSRCLMLTSHSLPRQGRLRILIVWQTFWQRASSSSVELQWWRQIARYLMLS